MDIHDDLDLQWSDIEGQGLIRVLRTDSFRTGFVFLAHIGLAAEQTEYYPEVTLTSHKLTITIPPHDDGLDHRLAHAIDSVLVDAAQS